MDMSKFKKYSSAEIREIAKMAEAKGLILLERGFKENKFVAKSNDNNKRRGYYVMKEVAGQYIVLTYYDSVFCAYLYNGPSDFRDMWFYSTFEQAKELILNFEGEVDNSNNQNTTVTLDAFPEKPIRIIGLRSMDANEVNKMLAVLGEQPCVETEGERE